MRPLSRRLLSPALALAILLTTVPAVLLASAGTARAVGPGEQNIPVSSVQIPYHAEFGEIERGEIVLNFFRYKTCHIDAWSSAPVDQLGRYNPSDNTYSIIRHDGWGNDAYEERVPAGERVKLGSYGAYYFNPEGGNEPLDPSDPRCRATTIDAWKAEMESGRITLWTMGERSLVADFTHEVSTETQGQVAFTSTTEADFSLDQVEHSWDFGDETASTERDPVHRYAEPGVYQVRLTVEVNGEQDTIVHEVKVLPPELKVAVREAGTAEEPDAPVATEIELRPGEETELEVEVWTTYGFGPLTEVRPDVADLIDVPDGVEIVEAEDVPAEGISLDPGSSRTFEVLVKATTDGEGTLTSAWAGKDVSEDEVRATGELGYRAPALVVTMTATPDPLLLGVDLNGDDEVDEDDQVLSIAVEVENTATVPVTGITAPGPGDSPIGFTLMDGQEGSAPTRRGTHPRDFGDLQPGESTTITYEFDTAHQIRTTGSIRLSGTKAGGPEVAAEASVRVRVVSGKALAMELTDEREGTANYRAGQTIRMRGTLENLTRIEIDGEVLDEGHPIGVMVYPVLGGNVGNGFVVPESYGGKTPTEPTPIMLDPGEKIDIRAVVPTHSLPTESQAEISFQVAAWLHDQETPEEHPSRLPARRIDLDGPESSDTTSVQTIPLLADPPINDPWLTCSKTALGFLSYASCMFTDGLHNAAVGFWGLAKMVGQGLYQIGYATLRTATYTLWVLQKLAEAVRDDPTALDELAADIAINLQAMEQVGVESVRGIGGMILTIPQEILRAIADILTMLGKGDIKGAFGELAKIAGENADMAFEALVKARTAAKLIEAASDATSPAAKAFQHSLDEQAASLGARVEDALNTGGVNRLVKEGVLKSGDRLTAISAAWKAMGLSQTDLDILLDIAQRHNVMLAFRARSARASELLATNRAWQKPGDVPFKTVNDLDQIYLDYKPDWEGKVVLVEPPVDWTLTGQARESAINAYLDRFGQLTSPSDFSRDLRARVRDRLELRMKEYPKGVQSFVKYRDRGIDTNFHIEKQGLPADLLANSSEPWRARAVVDDIAAGSAGNARRRATILEMAPPGSDDFRAITGDIDFLGIFKLDGSLLDDVPSRVQVYEALRNALGMQHGESFSYSPDVVARDGWLGAHKVGGETMLVANADRNLYATHIRDDLSAMDFNPNHQYMEEAGRPFTFMEGMIVETSSEVRLPAPAYTGPTWESRMEEIYAAYKKYDPKELMKKVQEADKNKDEETFDRLMGRLWRINEKGVLEEYLRSGGAPGPKRAAPSAGVPTWARLVAVAAGSAEGDEAWELLEDDLDGISRAGGAFPDASRLGGSWVPRGTAEALGSDGRLPVTPMSYLAEDAAAGTVELNLMSLRDLRMDPATGSFAVGDTVILDPGGPHEQEARVASVAPFRLTEALELPLRAGTTVAVLSPVMLGLGARNTAAPKVLGQAVVGSTLRAGSGSWSPAPAGLSYQWLRNGVPIAGARAVTYRPVLADLGKRLSVRVTAAATGYRSAVAASAQTPVVRQRSTLKVAAKRAGTKVRVRVRIAGAGVAKAQCVGRVIVRRGAKVVARLTVTKGKANVVLRRQPAKRTAYAVTYEGAALLTPATVTTKVRAR